MRREERLKGKTCFGRVLNERKSWANQLFVLKASPNGLSLNRYGLTVSKRVGGAVTRNRVKRLLRETLRLMPTHPGWDIVFIARKAAAGASFQRVKVGVQALLSQAKIGAPQGPVAMRPAETEANET